MRTALLLALALPLLASPAFSQVTSKAATISVQATGTASVAPDLATLNLSVIEQAKTARAALDANTASMSKVLAAMKEAGIEERDLQTSGFSIQPQYRYFEIVKSTGERRPPEIIGYRVSNGLNVRVRDLTKLGTILDRSVTLGVNNGGGISFGSSKSEETLEEARKDAMAKAVAKAKTLTETAGVGLGKVLSISEQGGRRQPQLQQMARAKSFAEAAAPVPIAAGEGNYSITVNVQWEIAQ